jgi:hypothetical protein
VGDQRAVLKPALLHNFGAIARGFNFSGFAVNQALAIDSVMK